MKTDCKGCFGAANNDCERCEEERGQEIFFTDLTPYFTKDIKDGVLTGAWVIEEGEQKELILKFDEHISGIEKMVCLQLIGQNLIEIVASQNEADFLPGITGRNTDPAVGSVGRRTDTARDPTHYHKIKSRNRAGVPVVTRWQRVA